MVETSDRRPTPDEIRAALPNYIGSIQQVPPRYSAIKIEGERAYDLARDGQTVELQARTVDIGRLELVEVPDADHAVLEAECGKGTYVRSLARDIGRQLGCYGHVSALRRVARGERVLSPDIAPRIALALIDGGPDPLRELSSREFEVLRLLLSGLDHGGIAERLHISPKTAQNCHYQIKAKLGARNDIDLARIAARHGLDLG